ncbi:MAG: dihydroxyacetone kinase, partial [Selenomonadaceae bacterium]|nr:dihydroxyacetone kinase [Selenomonadaceae bacterium]
HALGINNAIMPVAAVAVADGKEQAQRMQDAGAHVIVAATKDRCPSVVDLVSAAHSDLASSYVLLASDAGYWMVFRQAKRMLGERVELVLCKDEAAQERALRAFDGQKTAAENAAAMIQAAEIDTILSY